MKTTIIILCFSVLASNYVQCSSYKKNKKNKKLIESTLIGTDYADASSEENILGPFEDENIIEDENDAVTEPYFGRGYYSGKRKHRNKGYRHRKQKNHYYVHHIHHYAGPCDSPITPAK